MTTVTVAPTETTLATLDVSVRRGVSIQIVNLDATQTLSCTIYVRNKYEPVWAPTTFPDFAVVGPGSSVAAVVPCEGVSELELRGYMSGSGGDARVTWA